jgi:hypothetical protein
MYLDKLDGRVDSAFFDKMSAQFHEEQNCCLCEIARHESAEESDMDEGVQIVELARNAQKLFELQQPREKSPGERRGGRHIPTRLILAQTADIAMLASTSSDSNSAKSEIWLADIKLENRWPASIWNHRPAGVPIRKESPIEIQTDGNSIQAAQVRAAIVESSAPADCRRRIRGAEHRGQCSGPVQVW